MISYDRSSSGSSMLVWIVLAMVLGGGAAVWWWMDRSEPSVSSVAESASAPAVNVAPQMVPAEAMPAQVQADMSTTEAATLNQALGSKEQGQQELQRVTSFLNFQRGFEKWQAMQEATDPGPRHALAQQLVDGLPQRVQLVEITLPEAEFMCGMLLTDLEPDEVARNQRWEGCKQKIAAVAPRTDTEQTMRAAQCQTEYRRREAALVAEFQAKPAAQRDPRQLEVELNKAKRAVYDSPTCGQ
jgi:hypothetical protein